MQSPPSTNYFLTCSSKEFKKVFLCKGNIIAIFVKSDALKTGQSARCGSATPLIPILRRLRQADRCEFQISYMVSFRTSQGYPERPCLKSHNHHQQNKQKGWPVYSHLQLCIDLCLTESTLHLNFRSAFICSADLI